MIVCLEGSRPARTVRTETVLPAPTSPVMTPMARSLTHQVMRATASLWAACRCSMPGARLRPKGMRVNPEWACSFSITGVSWLVVGGVAGLDAGKQVFLGVLEGGELGGAGAVGAGVGQAPHPGDEGGDLGGGRGGGPGHGSSWLARAE